jgi:hypothetical protein
VYEWAYKGDLDFDLLTTHCWRFGQVLELIEGARELLNGFHQGRPLQRPLPCLPPQAHSLLDKSGLGAVARQQLWPVLGDFGEVAF